MKKITLAMAVAGALGTTGAMAYTLGTFGNGALIPQAVYSGTGYDTVVGLISGNCSADRAFYNGGTNGNTALPNYSFGTNTATVYWTFFNVNSAHVWDDEFSMTNYDMEGFSWRANADGNFEGQEGYLVFAADTNGGGALDTSDVACLAANAFQVDLASNDVSYIPAPPMYTQGPDGSVDGNTTLSQGNDFGLHTGGVFVNDLANMDNTSVQGLYAGAQDGTLYGPDGNTHVDEDTVYMRFFLDNATTDIVVWSVGPEGSATTCPRTYTVNVFDDDQDRRSTNFTLPNCELNHIAPGTDIAIPSAFTDGFIRWNLFDSERVSVFSFSVIDAAAFGATQTLLNPHEFPTLETAL
jgi:hypothetical protein